MSNEQKDTFPVKVGDVVEVLNQDGEVPGNLYFCARGARGYVVSIFNDEYVKININGNYGITRLSNVVPYKP
jgi:hypothetical protein